MKLSRKGAGCILAQRHHHQHQKRIVPPREDAIKALSEKGQPDCDEKRERKKREIDAKRIEAKRIMKLSLFLYSCLVDARNSPKLGNYKTLVIL